MLTKEILCAYLAYDLKGVDYFQGHALVRDITHHNFMAIIDGDTKLKPLLRSLSSLTKPITHNGETFVPMVELYKIARGRFKDAIVKYWEVMSTHSIIVEQEGFNNFIFSLVKSDSDLRIENSFNFQLHSTDLHNDNPKPVMVQCLNTLFQKLHEWKFDLYSLLESGHAIELKEVDNG